MRGTAGKVLMGLEKTYSHILEIVLRAGESGIKCRSLCAQTTRRVVSENDFVG